MFVKSFRALPNFCLLNLPVSKKIYFYRRSDVRFVRFLCFCYCFVYSETNLVNELGIVTYADLCFIKSRTPSWFQRCYTEKVHLRIKRTRYFISTKHSSYPNFCCLQLGFVQYGLYSTCFLWNSIAWHTFSSLSFLNFCCPSILWLLTTDSFTLSLYVLMSPANPS